ncbi:unnamed protein product [Lymnaea stagnalis]|uniref:Ig-like domain-containing protein n=1 Tax=Lymnaea stagnalis TaxID=6523 RepID=A0AAV2HIP5_LYMST
MKLILFFYYLCFCRSVLCVHPILDKTNVSTGEPFMLVCDHLRCETGPDIDSFFLIELGKSGDEALNTDKPYLAKLNAKDEARHVLYDTYDVNIPAGRDWLVSFSSDNSTHNRDVLNVTIESMGAVMEDAGNYFCRIYSRSPAREYCQEEITLTVYRALTEPPTSPPTQSMITTTTTTTPATTTTTEPTTTFTAPAAATEPTTTTTVTTTKKPPPTNHGNCIVTRDLQDVLGRLFIALAVWLLKTIF